MFGAAVCWVKCRTIIGVSWSGNTPIDDTKNSYTVINV